MKVTKKRIDTISMPYSVNGFAGGGVKGIIFASEGRDSPCRLYDATGGAETLWTAPGGVMNVIQDGEAPAVWSIQKFFPIFDSAEAEVVRSERDAHGTWSSTTMARLPFVHRIARFVIDGHPYLLACTLCSKKEFQQDWSHPGAVYVSPILPGRPLEFVPVLEGLTKNHGLGFCSEGGREIPLVSASQGIFRIELHGRDRTTWRTEKIHDRESSEAVLFDIDGDGEAELITIDGFHGDEVRIHKKAGPDWIPRCFIPIAFGHVLWAGMLLGRRCILTASRAGQKDTTLHFPAGGLDDPWQRLEVDVGAGATQIAVDQSGTCPLLYASNHGANEIAVYRIEE